MASKNPLASILNAIPILWQLLCIPSILEISVTCSDIRSTVDMILLSHDRWKHKLLVLKVSTRKHLANIFATYLFGGYCVPFKVNEDSPNLLKLDFGSHMFQETKFEMKNQCKWSGFEDTYAMRFTNVEYGEAKLTPPESVADRFRQFSNPFFDPSFLLNKSTLENVGMLLPANTTYIARWAQSCFRYCCIRSLSGFIVYTGAAQRDV